MTSLAPSPSSSPSSTKAAVTQFETRHIVTFEETNVVGNVYYANYFSWQGRCRELFLQRHAPELLAELEAGELRMVTAHASCDFLDEFRAFDEVLIRMQLLAFIPFGLSLGFEYSALGAAGQPGDVVARGRQDLKFLRRHGDSWQLAQLSRVSPSLASVLGAETP
ncbi:MAG TPA: acyl-CoA thioesterase [Burkholderiaceae bacterium]|jgi:enediyne biosynthesis thioesterase